MLFLFVYRYIWLIIEYSSYKYDIGFLCNIHILFCSRDIYIIYNNKLPERCDCKNILYIKTMLLHILPYIYLI